MHQPESSSDSATASSSALDSAAVLTSLRAALNGRNSLVTAKKAFQSTAAISQRIAFTVSCACPGAFSTGYFAVASTAKAVHIISMSTGREVTCFSAKSPVFSLACGRQNTIMFGDTFGNLYVADSMNHTIRQIAAGAAVTTIAGSAGASGTGAICMRGSW